MSQRLGTTIIMACALAACAGGPAPAPSEGEWVSLFNGRDLDGWTPKFAGHELGENVLDTFRVEDGVLKVSYDHWQALDGRFGHLFYARPFSHYRLRVEYRFVGEQVGGAQSWALRNNGIMIHAQPPETMGRDQNFPASMEVQLLGGDGVNPRTTGNLCTPATSAVIEGERVHTHCINSSSATFAGEQWVTAEVEVRGARLIRHFINGEQVFAYSAPLLDEPASWAPALELESGYVALQAESHPTEFRRIEIMVLAPDAP